MLKKISIVLLLFVSVMSQTESQIKEAKKVIKKQGLTESQVKQIAKNRGYTDSQIESVLKKDNSNVLERNKSDQDLFKAEKIIDDEVNNKEKKTESEDFNTKSIKSTKTSGTGYFGYNIFKRDPALFQSTSVGVVDPNYLIGAGDEIIVMLWGETQFRQIFKVDREGFVFIPEIGQIFVNGLTLNLLESKLFRVFSQAYESLQPPGRNPTTFLDVSLGNLRPLRVQVLGEVSQPGYYTVSPSTTLFSSLYYFNGPTRLGSLRDVQLIRSGKKITSIDFYDFLLTGKKRNDQKLQLDDVIFIPNRMKTIELVGEVNRPGIYEMRSNETLGDLIELAANIKPTAYLGRVQIDRITPFEEREELGGERKLLDVNLKNILNKTDKFELKNGDIIKIFSISEARNNIAFIEGAVLRPGAYDIEDSLKVKDLILKADSLLGDAYLDRLEIVRLNSNGTEELIKLDLNKVLKNNKSHNILVKPLDKIKVYGISNMSPQRFVKIRGHVKKPGDYQLKDNMTLFDLIFVSGGFLDNIYKKRTYLKRADLYRFDENKIQKKIISFNLNELLDEKSTKINLLLEPDDEIVIFAKSIFENIGTITIEGAIKNPGVYNYKEDNTLIDLILEAGGVLTGEELYRIDITSREYNMEEGLFYNSKIFFMNEDYFFRRDGESKYSKNIELKLKPEDKIRVRLYPKYSEKSVIRIEGAVKFPGLYDRLNDVEKISSIIKRAGGFEKNALLDAAFLERDNDIIRFGLKKLLKNKKAIQNMEVKDKDVIRIPEKKNIYKVLGEVNVPGTYILNDKFRISDVVKNSGGFTENYDSNNIFITYPDGSSKKYYRIIKNYKVKDSSVIFVGKKAPKEPFDLTEYLKESTSIIANVVQIVSILLIAK